MSTDIDAVPSDSLQKLLDDIDRDIRFHENIVLALKSRRNSLAPIFRLPSELICRIIKETQLPRRDESDNHPNFMSFEVNSGWTAMLRICKHVRSIALAAPELWTFIDTGLQDIYWISNSLKRARGVPLVFKYDCNQLDPFVREKGEIALVTFPRAHAASLLVDGTNTVDVQDLLLLSAPVLHTLAITGRVEENIMA
jgi:hypothetical protein